MDVFVRGKSPLLEITAKKSDSYEVFVSKAARKMSVADPPREDLIVQNE